MKSIFEKIIDRDVDADIVYEDGLAIAFKDINPVAPKHFLVVPKKRIASIQTVSGNDMHLFSHIFSVIQKLAIQENLVEKGYRVVTNIGEYGGQTVDHLHFHVIGGRNLRWPPG
ncbi:MAG: histidine triad nucleotide-binding protein [Candidatus Caenarcaniphilales bacterium]|nr:histidine triad nucleotide-binding protein [Candidatus Caenarcaniphilales bacterium]